MSRHPGLPGGAAAAGANANIQATPNASAFTPNDRRFGRDRNAPPGFRAGNEPSPARALRNQTFADPARLAGRAALANATFRGRFAAARFASRGPNAGQQQRFFHRHRVIGWYGRTFWPYAYNDMFDYAFWPYAYDTFWPYAYDDLYGGVFGPYAYGYDERSAPPPPPQAQLGPDSEPIGATDPEARVCNEQAAALTNWPIERISEAVQPNATQRMALNRLSQATGRAVGILQASCPTQLPSTPTGRLQTLQSRLEAMLRAVDTIAPALNAFYQSLNDEQRARFDSVGQDKEPDPSDQEKTELANACGERGAGVVLPIDRIAQEVRPDGRQSAALDNLADASTRAGEMLKSNCPTETALTPTGRIDAMKQRLANMLNAVIMVRPALEAFYGSLNSEQRARFNVIGADAG